VCYLLVLDSVTSTPQWIRQPKPRGCVFVFVCKYVLGRFRATQPPNLRLCLLRHCGFLTSPHAIPTRSGCHPNSCRLLRRSTSAPHLIPRAHFLHLPTSPRLSGALVFFYGVESKESDTDSAVIKKQDSLPRRSCTRSCTPGTCCLDSCSRTHTCILVMLEVNL
jgi:hypothetical protein